MPERVKGHCPECGREVYLVPGNHTMRGGPPTCPGAHIRLVKFFEDFDELPDWLQVQIEQVRAEGENAGLEKAALIAESFYEKGSAHTYASENADVYLAQEHASELIAERIRAAKSEQSYVCPDCGYDQEMSTPAKLCKQCGSQKAKVRAAKSPVAQGGDS